MTPDDAVAAMLELARQREQALAQAKESRAQLGALHQAVASEARVNVKLRERWDQMLEKIRTLEARVVELTEKNRSLRRQLHDRRIPEENPEPTLDLQ